MNKSIIKNILKLFNIAVFFWSFWGEKILFYPEMIIEKKQVFMYILIKIMLVLLLYLEYMAVNYIIDIYEKKITKLFIKFFLVLVGIYSVFFNFIYPGVWNYDSVGIVHLVRGYGTAIISQGLITNLFTGAVLSVIPSVSAVVVVQYTIALAITSYIAVEVYEITNRKWISILLLVVEVLPLSIITNMITMRMCLYGHFILLLVYYVWEECFIKKEQELSIKKAIMMGTLTGIVSSFRFEALLVWIFVSSIIVIAKKNCKWSKTTLILCSIVTYLLIGNISGKLMGYSNTKSDIANAMCTSLSVMLQNDLNGNVNEWLKSIDRIIDVEIVRQHPTSWYPMANDDYGAMRELSQVNMFQGIVDYGKIILFNLDDYFRAKCEQLKVVHNWNEIGYSSIDEELLSSIYGVIANGGIYKNEAELYNMPFENIRSILLNKLYNLTGKEDLDNILLGIIPSMMFMFIVLVISIIKKYKVLLGLSIMCISKFAIFMVGMAMSWPIYFGPIVLEGWILIVLVTASCYYRKNNVLINKNK